MGTIKVVRIYDKNQPETAYRILVDRLWPRGVKKESAHLDFWSKETAPSTELRKWFNHDDEKFLDFYRKYTEELNRNEATNKLLALVTGALKSEDVVLLYAAKNQAHNEAVVLKDFLLEQIK